MIFKNVKDKKYIFTLLIISIISFFSNIWVRDADLMEQRNFITAREMIKNGNYFVTTLNNNLRFEKPPLPTWLTAFVMKITNNFADEWVLRIPAALTGILLVFFIYYMVKLLTNSSTKAFFSAFVAETMFMLIKTSNENSWDIYTYSFAFGGILFLLYGFKYNKISYYISSGIFLALSIMSKGPVGIYGIFIPFIISYIWAFGIKEFKENWKNILLMLVVTIVLASIWPVAMYLKYPDYFLSILNKEQNTWSNRHTQSVIFYLDYFIYTGVWIFFSIIAFFKNWKTLKQDKYSKFIFIWNILVIIFLSAIKMKKKRYGIPIYVTTSLNIGFICSYYWTTLWTNLKKYDRVLLYIQSGFIILVSLAISILFLIESFYYKRLNPFYAIVSSIIYFIILYTIVKLFKFRKNLVGRFIIIVSGLFMVLVNINASWYIDTNLLHKKTTNNYLTARLLRQEPPKLDIYSTNFSVDDIWNAGKQIKPFDNNFNFPNKLIILGEIPENLKDDYNIRKTKIFSDNEGDILKLYYLKKKER